MPAARISALAQPHRFRDSVPWLVSPKGVVVSGKLERTPGPPNTVTHVWETYHAAINAAASRFQVPAHLIIATICTESQPIGNARSLRTEPGFVSDEATPHRVSPGLMQTLISTARSALRNPKIDRKFLFNPANSIMAGTCVIKQGHTATNLDPPKVAAAYNAGSLIHQGSSGNRWKMRQFPIGTSAHVDRFVMFFNDACAMLAVHPIRPTVGLEAIIGDAGRTPAAKKVVAAKKAAKVLAAKTSLPAARPAPAAISFGANAKVAALTPFSKRVLQDIMRDAGIPFALITSTQRTPAEQARAMFNNLEALGVKSQKDLYGPNGDLVIDVFVAGKRAGKTAAQIQKDMERRIIGLGPSNVSHHAADPKVLNVFDVAPNSIPAAKRAAFERAARRDKRVRKFFAPGQGDPGFHIEIPQPLR
jgi:hypothetical protein